MFKFYPWSKHPISSYLLSERGRHLILGMSLIKNFIRSQSLKTYLALRALTISKKILLHDKGAKFSALTLPLPSFCEILTLSLTEDPLHALHSIRGYVWYEYSSTGAVYWTYAPVFLTVGRFYFMFHFSESQISILIKTLRSLLLVELSLYLWYP